MPNDPIVNDHYGDILWKLNRKIQARYFWSRVLEMKNADKEILEKINVKLIKGDTKFLKNLPESDFYIYAGEPSEIKKYSQNEIDAGLQNEGINDKYEIKVDDDGKIDIRKRIAFKEGNFNNRNR